MEFAYTEINKIASMKVASLYEKQIKIAETNQNCVH